MRGAPRTRFDRVGDVFERSSRAPQEMQGAANWASNFLDWCPDTDHADYRTVTVSLGTCSAAADAFISFQVARRHLGQRLYDLRETSL